MGGTYRRTILLTLLAVGTSPFVILIAVMVVLARGGGEDVARVELALAFGLLVAAVLAAIGGARMLGAPIQRLTEGLALLMGGNRRHRLPVPEEADLAGLVRSVNELADRSDRARSEVEAELAAATHQLAVEKETLQSVLLALSDGIVVCDDRGRVVLSNVAAQTLLSRPELPLRRGEDIFAYMDRAALRPLIDTRSSPDGRAAAGGRLGRATLRLLGGPLARVTATRVEIGQEAPHIVLVVRDVTDQATAERLRDRLLDETARRLRGPIASVLSAAEILVGYGELDDAQRSAFLEILRRDAGTLAEELDQLAAADQATFEANGIVDAVAVRELAEGAAVELVPRLEADGVVLSTGGEDLYVRGDRVGLLRVVSGLLDLAAARASDRGELAIRWQRAGRNLVELVIEVPGAMLGELDERDFERPLAGIDSTLREVVKEHRGETWVRQTANGAAFVILLPTPPERADQDARPTAERDAIGHQVLALLGEGGFFDPRVPAEASLASAEARLVDLSFIVFDLETTGLGPATGDEIVSIGAVRVRGGRVVPEDHFTALVKPGRLIPATSTGIHGITNEMVSDRPPLAVALPLFLEFIGESVPVAHVAAFDLAFLNPRLVQLGLPPIGLSTVLDTLLLSYSLFPAWSGYNVEEIAARLGVDVVGRHTALGDALTTAEIFVRLLGVLDRRGVTTLGAALKLQSGDVIRKLVATVQAELQWG